MGCDVLPGVFGVAVQGILFVCCMGVLLFKFSRDKVRSFKEFALDSSKQIIGAGWIHVLNLAFAEKLEENMETGDQCEWYWVNIMVDTTIGVLVEYALLHLINGAIDTYLPDQASDFESGAYKNPATGEFMPKKYAKQLGVWVVVVSGMKISMLVLMLVACMPLQKVSALVLGPVMKDKQLKLLAVMIVTPLCMNAFQFWVVDNIIKLHPNKDQGKTGGGEFQLASQGGH
jgi:hypothetical protein